MYLVKVVSIHLALGDPGKGILIVPGQCIQSKHDHWEFTLNSDCIRTMTAITSILDETVSSFGLF